MNVVILAAGDFPRKPYPLYLLEQADALVCCDGAVRAALRHGLKVDAVVGDMDSAPGAFRNPGACSPQIPGSLSQTPGAGAHSDSRLAGFCGEVVHIAEQDDNDLTKALRYVLERYPSATDITILGATGKREAHTVGNLSLLMEYEKQYGFWARGISVQMVSDWSTAFAVGDTCTLSVGEGRAVSLFTCDPSLQVRSDGLQWPLEGVRFDNWWRATLNRATADEIRLEFSHPAPLLVILD